MTTTQQSSTNWPSYTFLQQEWWTILFYLFVYTRVFWISRIKASPFCRVTAYIHLNSIIFISQISNVSYLHKFLSKPGLPSICVQMNCLEFQVCTEISLWRIPENNSMMLQYAYERQYVRFPHINWNDTVITIYFSNNVNYRLSLY